MVRRGSLCGGRCGKKMGAVKGVCLDYASSFDPLEPTSDFVGYCGMIFGA